MSIPVLDIKLDRKRCQNNPQIDLWNQKNFNQKQIKLCVCEKF